MLKTQKLQDTIREKGSQPTIVTVDLLRADYVRNYTKHFAYTILLNPYDKFKRLKEVK